MITFKCSCGEEILVLPDTGKMSAWALDHIKEKHPGAAPGPTLDEIMEKMFRVIAADDEKKEKDRLAKLGGTP